MTTYHQRLLIPGKEEEEVAVKEEDPKEEAGALGEIKEEEGGERLL